MKNKSFKNIKTLIVLIILVLTVTGWVLFIPTLMLMIAVFNNDVLYWKVAGIAFIELAGGPFALFLIPHIFGPIEYPSKG